MKDEAIIDLYLQLMDVRLSHQAGDPIRVRIEASLTMWRDEYLAARESVRAPHKITRRFCEVRNLTARRLKASRALRRFA